MASLPADWDSAPLGREDEPLLLLLRNGLTVEQSKNIQQCRITRIETISDGFIDENKVRSVTGLSIDQVEKYRIRKDDILFSHINSDPHLGKSAIALRDYDDLLHGMNLLLLRANSAVLDPSFLHLVCCFYRVEGVFVKICSRSVNQSSINQAKLKALEVPLPPLSEQRKIAGVLGLVQQAIEHQEQLIAMTTELKKTLLHQLFTQGLRGEPQKQTEIGLVPESWEVVKIGDLFKFSSGKSRPQDTEPTASESKPFPVFGGNGVLGYSGSFLLEEPVLLLGRVGEYCGCAHHTNGCAWISDNALYAKEIMGDIDTHYAAEYLAYADLNQYSNRAGQPLITQGIISEVKIPLPSLDEQLEILEPLRFLNQKRKYHEAKRNAVADLFRTLLHQLMTAQIRVDNLEL